MHGAGDVAPEIYVHGGSWRNDFDNRTQLH